MAIKYYLFTCTALKKGGLTLNIRKDNSVLSL